VLLCIPLVIRRLRFSASLEFPLGAVWGSLHLIGWLPLSPLLTQVQAPGYG
jgi:hypothetical protein